MVQDWFEWVNWFRFGFRVNTSTGQTLVNDSQLSGQRRSTQDPVAFYKLRNGWNRRTHGNSST
ncbi:hypothetical protein Hdeb2414_s0007g00239921 [Helianthus debilis subsp. tardiflorus]